jgi:predicted RNA methylase
MEIDDVHGLLAKAGRWHTQEAFERYHVALFAGITLKGRRVLDVGGGIGACSFWAAAGGASDVLCLEPGDAGATTGTSQRFEELARELELPNVRLQTVRLQDLDAAPGTFDVIVMNNSVNHLDEEACVALKTSEAARQSYLTVFRRIAELARAHADLVIADCTSNNLFPLLGLRHPISRSIEWHKHHPPEIWAEVLAAVGFEGTKIQWTPYARLGWLGWWLTANRLAAFVLTGHFILKMRRR